MSNNVIEFDPDCTDCSRLNHFLEKIRDEYPDYHCRPVPPFGVKNPKLLIVGLAPGMHGANATGRPFTGDYAGILLYQTLHKFGFSNNPESNHNKDGLKLKNCRITNAVKCLPPKNKPDSQEINNCNQYLIEELKHLDNEKSVILVLGRIAHQAVIKALGLKQKDFLFAHNACAQIDGTRLLISSYHCSRYNTQTGRLTTQMFEKVFKNITDQLNMN